MLRAVIIASIISLQKIGGSWVSSSAHHSQIALPNCPEKCGNLTIPYPFGIGEGCFYNNSIYATKDFHSNMFSLSCSNSTTYLGGYDIKVVNITLDGGFWVLHRAAYDCYAYNTYIGRTHPTFSSNKLIYNKFKYSPTKNSLVAIGCDTYVWFAGSHDDNQSTEVHSGCMTLCDDIIQAKMANNTCGSGFGCCKASIPDGMFFINITAQSFRAHEKVVDFNPCSVAFVIANDAIPSNFAHFLSKDAAYFENLRLPVVYEWSIVGNGDCKSLPASEAYLCKGNSVCLDFNGGYRCQCKPGFEGNPYLHDCQDINECSNKNPCKFPAYCVNTVGSFSCLCPQGYSADVASYSGCILSSVSTDQSRYKLLIGLSVSLGSILLFLVGCWLYKLIKRKQAIKQRATYFEKNVGLLLQQQQMSLGEGVVERTKIFTIAELQKATDNFSEDRILGQGGHGTVYKGMLGEGKLVAVKKSRKLEESEMREFINEVAILSQINHKNIVKLLGCCLETEVPLLVFEFIPNGTLFNHIHYPSEEFPITWKMRLQIASDSAGALAYLHYSSSIPIFHRDIKSSNIL